MVAMPEMAAQLPATVGKVKYGLRSSPATTFAVSMAFSWFLHNSLSERDAYALIDRAFDDPNYQQKLREKVAYEKAFTMPANHETCAEVVAALREELDIL